jgi:hypothetical protein
LRFSCFVPNTLPVISEGGPQRPSRRSTDDDHGAATTEGHYALAQAALHFWKSSFHAIVSLII